MDRVFKTFKAKNGKEIILREPRMSDLNQLLEFINTIIKENLTLDNPFTWRTETYNIEEEEKWLVKTLADIREKKKLHVVAETDGEIIASSDIIRKEGMANHLAEFGIIIAKPYRGLGIGTAIMEILSPEAKKIGIEIIYLYTYVTNEPATALYKKMGFKEHSIFKKSLKVKGRYIDGRNMYKEL